MALLFKNHTATIYPVSETADPVTKVVPVPEEGTGVEIACQIRPLRNRVVIDAETGIELMNPHGMRFEPEDVDSVQYGYRVVWQDTDLQFRITNRPNPHLADGLLEPLNCYDVEMELLEVA
jgi:hypothetical protein